MDLEEFPSLPKLPLKKNREAQWARVLRLSNVTSQSSKRGPPPAPPLARKKRRRKEQPY